MRCHAYSCPNLAATWKGLRLRDVCGISTVLRTRNVADFPVLRQSHKRSFRKAQGLRFWAKRGDVLGRCYLVCGFGISHRQHHLLDETEFLEVLLQNQNQPSEDAPVLRVFGPEGRFYVNVGGLKSIGFNPALRAGRTCSAKPLRRSLTFCSRGNIQKEKGFPELT